MEGNESKMTESFMLPDEEYSLMVQARPSLSLRGPSWQIEIAHRRFELDGVESMVPSSRFSGVNTDSKVQGNYHQFKSVAPEGKQWRSLSRLSKPLGVIPKIPKNRTFHSLALIAWSARTMVLGFLCSQCDTFLQVL